MTDEEMYATLEARGKEIGAMQETNKLAGRLVTYYQMHHAAPGDPGAKALVKVTLEAWLKDHPNPKEKANA